MKGKKKANSTLKWVLYRFSTQRQISKSFLSYRFLFSIKRPQSFLLPVSLMHSCGLSVHSICCKTFFSIYSFAKLFHFMLKMAFTWLYILEVSIKACIMQKNTKNAQCCFRRLFSKSMDSKSWEHHGNLETGVFYYSFFERRCNGKDCHRWKGYFKNLCKSCRIHCCKINWNLIKRRSIFIW